VKKSWGTPFSSTAIFAPGRARARPGAKIASPHAGRLSSTSILRCGRHSGKTVRQSQDNGVLPTSEFDGDPDSVIYEFDPFEFNQDD
jgi:hypothetical protein